MDQPEDFYAPPAAPVSDVTSDTGDLALLSVFVGKRAGYYMPHFRKLQTGNRGRESWNVGAFFFGPIYFLYRKMYRIALLVLVGSWAIDWVASQMLSAAGTGKYNASATTQAVNLGVGLFLSYRANRWYYRHAAAHLLRARAEASGGALQDLLRRRGGTSLAVALLGSLVLLGLVMIPDVLRMMRP